MPVRRVGWIAGANCGLWFPTTFIPRPADRHFPSSVEAYSKPMASVTGRVHVGANQHAAAVAVANEADNSPPICRISCGTHCGEDRRGGYQAPPQEGHELR